MPASASGAGSSPSKPAAGGSAAAAPASTLQNRKENPFEALVLDSTESAIERLGSVFLGMGWIEVTEELRRTLEASGVYPPDPEIGKAMMLSPSKDGRIVLSSLVCLELGEHSVATWGYLTGTRGKARTITTAELLGAIVSSAHSGNTRAFGSALGKILS